MALSCREVCELPAFVWRRVFKWLDIEDICELSLTCDALYDVSASYFRTVTVSLALVVYSEDHQFPVGQLSSRQLHHVKCLGHLFTKVNILVFSFYIELCSFHCLLENLGRSSSALRSLSAENVYSVGLNVMTDPCTSPFTLSELLHKVHQGKDGNVVIQLQISISLCLDIKREGIFDLYECSESDRRCRYLTRFSVEVGSFPYEELLYLQRPHLTFTPTAKLISKFPNLQHLTLPIYSFSDALLYQLADPTRNAVLKTLKMQTCLDIPIPTLSFNAWQSLVNSCPKLAVSCGTLYRTMSDNIFKALKTNVPLSELSAYVYSRDHLKYVINICTHYTWSLRTVTIDCLDPSSAEQSTVIHHSLQTLLEGAVYLNTIEYSKWKIKLSSTTAAHM